MTNMHTPVSDCSNPRYKAVYKDQTATNNGNICTIRAATHKDRGNFSTRLDSPPPRQPPTARADRPLCKPAAGRSPPPRCAAVPSPSPSPLPPNLSPRPPLWQNTTPGLLNGAMSCLGAGEGYERASTRVSPGGGVPTRAVPVLERARRRKQEKVDGGLLLLLVAYVLVSVWVGRGMRW